MTDGSLRSDQIPPAAEVGLVDVAAGLSDHNSTQLAVTLKSGEPASRLKRLFDCSLIGQFVVFKRAPEHAV